MGPAARPQRPHERWTLVTILSTDTQKSQGSKRTLLKKPDKILEMQISGKLRRFLLQASQLMFATSSKWNGFFYFWILTVGKSSSALLESAAPSSNSAGPSLPLSVSEISQRKVSNKSSTCQLWQVMLKKLCQLIWRLTNFVPKKCWMQLDVVSSDLLAHLNTSHAWCVEVRKQVGVDSIQQPRQFNLAKTRKHSPVIWTKAITATNRYVYVYLYI